MEEESSESVGTVPGSVEKSSAWKEAADEIFRQRPRQTQGDDAHRLAARLRDPLSEVTRKERKALLGVSAVAIIVAYTGILPQEIETIGVKFEETNQQSMLYVLAGFVSYLLLAFLSYAASDFFSWRLALVEAVRQQAKEVVAMEGLEGGNPVVEVAALREVIEQNKIVVRFTGYVTVTRSLVDFGVPIAVAVIALTLLLR